MDSRKVLVVVGSVAVVAGAGVLLWSRSRAGIISAEQLRHVMPRLAPEKAAEYLPHLRKALREAEITTPARLAAFLAQVAHESGELRWWVELASGTAYEGRVDLGNVQPGDGPRFKGRGPIQLSGRTNYREAGRALGIDLEANPERVAEPAVGFRTTAWYWKSRNLNRYADDGNFLELTRRINGGYNGLAQREAYHRTARAVLGVQS
jgi:predicted chitinase